MRITLSFCHRYVLSSLSTERTRIVRGFCQRPDSRARIEVARRRHAPKYFTPPTDGANTPILGNFRGSRNFYFHAQMNLILIPGICTPIVGNLRRQMALVHRSQGIFVATIGTLSPQTPALATPSEITTTTTRMTCSAIQDTARADTPSPTFDPESTKTTYCKFKVKCCKLLVTWLAECRRLYIFQQLIT